MGQLERIGNPPRKVVHAGVLCDADLIAAIQAKMPANRRKPPAGGFNFKKLPTKSVPLVNSIFMQCPFPIRHTEKNRLEWISRNGPHNYFSVTAGKIADPDCPGTMRQCEVPAGSKIRLIIVFINNYIYRTRKKVIPPWDSFRQAMIQFGIPKNCLSGQNGRELKRELENFFTSNIVIVRWSKDNKRVRQDQGPVGSSISFWKEQKGEKKYSWKYEMQVSQDYFDAVMAGDHMAPIHLPSLISLQRRPLAMDIFSYLCISLWNSTYSVTLSIDALHKLFGQNYAERKCFWRDFKISFWMAHEYYPEAVVALTDKGLTLHPSDPLVPRTTESHKTSRTA